jgi:hypothetical protein
MTLAGAVVTKPLTANHVYAGSPAKDITDKVGPQFEPVSTEERTRRFHELLEKHRKVRPRFSARLVQEYSERDRAKGISQFRVSDRTYLPTYSREEYRFMRFITYERAKFVPRAVARATS